MTDVHPNPTTAIGTWGVDAPGHPQLVLASDGTLSGTDGCNRLMGDWTAEDHTVNFGPLASTLMACEGVDTWLSGAASATIDGDIMAVMGAGGAQIGALDRQPS